MARVRSGMLFLTLAYGALWLLVMLIAPNEVERLINKRLK